jgi:excisionase family DNA binding protein
MAEQDSPSRRLSQPEAARYLGISERALRRLRYDGGIPYYQIGARVVYDTADLDEYLEDNRVEAG